MLVKFKTSIAGKIVAKPGEIVDLAKDEAQRHIAAGNAAAPDEIETATYRAREKALAEQRERTKKDAPETR